MTSPRNTGRRIVPSPARLGISRPSAQQELSELGWLEEECVPLLRALSASPDPNLCLATLVRLREAMCTELGGQSWEHYTHDLLANTTLCSRLIALLGSSTALGDHLVTHPAVAQHLDNPIPSFPHSLHYLLHSVEASPVDDTASTDLSTTGTYRAGITGPAAVVKLRSAYRDIMCLIAAVDVAHVVDNTEPQIPRRDTSERLTEIAEAALTAALAVAVSTVYPDPTDDMVRLAVIAMGKCGARELNYISDVDVVFVAEPANTKAARLAAEFMSISTHCFFEVDAALRPEGKKGDLVRSVQSHQAYYKRWAKTWEFQALLKARPMTGDMDLGRTYFDAIYPLVWTACERDQFVEDVQEMRKRVENNLPESTATRELKLGRGGLRDVEFAVQLLQMVHGRTDESLRVRPTGEALDALAKGGYISRKNGTELNRAYDFLRLLEHRLQLQHMRRTHLLPSDDNEAEWRWLARSAGCRPMGIMDTEQVLTDRIRRTRSRIRLLHESLFYRPLLLSIAAADASAVSLDNDAMERQLAALGYRNPRHAITHLRALTSSSSRRSRIQELLLPMMLEQLSRTPDPDMGLLNYRRLSEKLVDKTWYLRLLRDDGVVLERLAIICGTSRYIPDLLMNAPDVIQMLSGRRLVASSSSDIASALEASARRHHNPADAINAARSLRRAELARIACADVLGMLNVEEVCAALSTVWVAVLNAGLAVTIREHIQSKGMTEEDVPARIAVIGMGRLGGKEIGYSSDADVMFVCEPTSAAESTQKALRWSTEVVDKLQKLLEKPSTDPPLEIDADLRPEGKKGPLVRTLESYRTYYETWAEPWELQALLRAEPLAGDMKVGQKFIEMVNPLRYPEKLPVQFAQQIRRMKVRVETERMPRGVDPNLHTKLGRGGLSDIEWTVQLLQLQHAHTYPELQVTSTRAALEAATQAGLLSLDDEDTLWIAWSRATATRNALALARGKSLDVLPIQGEILASVAAICGWPVNSGAAYVENYLKSTRRARKVVERVFWEE